MGGGKFVVLVLWVLCAASFFVGGDATLASAGRWLFWILLAAHALECVVFLPVLRKAPGSLGHHLFQTMIYGILHVQGVRGAAEPAA